MAKVSLYADAQLRVLHIVGCKVMNEARLGRCAVESVSESDMPI